MEYKNMDTYDANATNAAFFSKAALNFRGRRGRLKYFFVSFFVIGADRFMSSLFDYVDFGVVSLFLYISLIALFQSLLVANVIKRIHDFNLSTKYGFLIWGFGTFANILMQMRYSIGAILLIPYVLVSLFILIKKGDSSDNRFGPVPR